MAGVCGRRGRGRIMVGVVQLDVVGAGYYGWSGAVRRGRSGGCGWSWIRTWQKWGTIW